MVLLCGRGLFFPQPPPGSEYLGPDSEVSVSGQPYNQLKACLLSPLTCSTWHVRARVACTCRS